MRPKSEIYTRKRDDEHPRHFHMGVPWESNLIPTIKSAFISSLRSAGLFGLATLLTKGLLYLYFLAESILPLYLIKSIYIFLYIRGAHFTTALFTDPTFNRENRRVLVVSFLKN